MVILTWARIGLTSIRHWRIMNSMQFIETSVFTRQVTALLTDEEYGQLQVALSAHPDAGILSQAAEGCGKSVGPSAAGANAEGYARSITGVSAKTRS